MATIQAQRPERQLGIGRIAALGAIAAVVAAGAAGGALSLWHDQAAAASEIHRAASSITITADGQTITPKTSGEVESVSLSATTMQTLTSTGAVAVPISVTQISEGTASIDTLIQLGIDPNSPIAKYASVTLSIDGTCTAPTRPASLAEVAKVGMDGVSTGSSDPAEYEGAGISHTETACLRIALPQTIENPIQYQNIGSVTSNENPTPTAASTWRATVTPPTADWTSIFAQASSSGIQVTPTIELDSSYMDASQCASVRG